MAELKIYSPFGKEHNYTVLNVCRQLLNDDLLIIDDDKDKVEEILKVINDCTNCGKCGLQLTFVDENTESNIVIVSYTDISVTKNSTISVSKQSTQTVYRSNQ